MCLILLPLEVSRYLKPLAMPPRNTCKALYALFDALYDGILA
jgi:hypothetical protein